MTGDFELPDAETLAYQLSEAVADQEGDDQAQGYLAAFVDELLTLEPGLAERFADAVLTDLAEEVARREDSHFAHATVELIVQIQTEWRNQA
ncbi:MAG: hypothetical protein M3R38_12265 [Actinomycetota bacterium]|nr:hypothetical protein [Actinomycetota bacterium]MDP9485449.1 hypothetical protein [Actinomycetota bacterium]